jgi:FkbM family methyltransferase
MGIWTLLDRAFQSGFKTPAAIAANLAVGLRGRDGRRFSVDQEGHWVSEHPQATFVSPAIHSTRYATVREKLIESCCYTYSPKPGDVVLDVGAGIGDEAVIFSEMVGRKGTIYSVEAHPDTFRCLTKTIQRSNITNVHPIHCAIIDEDRMVSIDSGYHLCNSVVDGGDIAVPGYAIYSICRAIGISKIDFLKMNIEGAERLAVHGFGDVEIHHAAISCHDFLNNPAQQTKEEVRAHLERIGYKVSERDHELPWVRDVLYADLL